MVYDLTIPNRYDWQFPLPGQPKAKVMGINLLQSCKQIRQETHSRVWYSSMHVLLPLPTKSDTRVIDLGIATCSLNDEALAKIPTLHLDIEVDPDNLSSSGLICLKKLSSFKSLWIIYVTVRWGSYYDAIRISKPGDDPTKTKFLKGLVIQILLQIPRHIDHIFWAFRFWEDYREDLVDALEVIGKEYRFLQGAHHERNLGKNDKNNIPSASNDLLVGQHIYISL